MAAKAIVCSFVVLAISQLLTAQQLPNPVNLTGFLSGFQLPKLPGFGQPGSSDSAGQGFFAIPFLNLFTSPSSTSEPSREKRAAAESEESEEPELQNRLFFTSFPTITTCNYTTEPGNTCRSCSQALRCLSNNLGVLTRCRGLFRYCNNNRCSLTQNTTCS